MPRHVLRISQRMAEGSTVAADLYYWEHHCEVYVERAEIRPEVRVQYSMSMDFVGCGDAAQSIEQAPETGTGQQALAKSISI